MMNCPFCFLLGRPRDINGYSLQKLIVLPYVRPLLQLSFSAVPPILFIPEKSLHSPYFFLLIDFSSKTQDFHSLASQGANSSCWERILFQKIIVVIYADDNLRRTVIILHGVQKILFSRSSRVQIFLPTSSWFLTIIDYFYRSETNSEANVICEKSLGRKSRSLWSSRLLKAFSPPAGESSDISFCASNQGVVNTCWDILRLLPQTNTMASSSDHMHGGQGVVKTFLDSLMQAEYTQS